MKNISYKDWGEVSETYEQILADAINKELENESEAQTRFDVIDRIIKEVLQWRHGQISVEPRTEGKRNGWIDYTLISGDNKIIVEAKKVGASFPNPSKRKKLKLNGSVLKSGEIGAALAQCEDYALQEGANIVVVTNGNCWCYYSIKDQNINREDIYAYLLFPFDDAEDAKQLFDTFACHKVENGSLDEITTGNPYVTINKLLNIVDDKDARIDRNNIADYISSTLDNAIRGEAILEDVNKLDFCYVSTEARTKYDTTLSIHLNDERPMSVLPAKKIRRDKKEGGLFEHIQSSEPTSTPPVTIVIGQVGAGKSTYLKHFELIQGSEILIKKKCH